MFQQLYNKGKEIFREGDAKTTYPNASVAAQSLYDWLHCLLRSFVRVDDSFDMLTTFDAFIEEGAVYVDDFFDDTSLELNSMIEQACQRIALVIEHLLRSIIDFTSFLYMLTYSLLQLTLLPWIISCIIRVFLWIESKIDRGLHRVLPYPHQEQPQKETAAAITAAAIITSDDVAKVGVGYAKDVCHLLDVYQAPPLNTYKDTLNDLPIVQEIERLKPLCENIYDEKKECVDSDMELVLEQIGAKANRDNKQLLIPNTHELTANGHNKSSSCRLRNSSSCDTALQEQDKEFNLLEHFFI